MFGARVFKTSRVLYVVTDHTIYWGVLRLGDVVIEEQQQNCKDKACRGIHRQKLSNNHVEGSRGHVKGLLLGLDLALATNSIGSRMRVRAYIYPHSWRTTSVIDFSLGMHTRTGFSLSMQL